MLLPVLLFALTQPRSAAEAGHEATLGSFLLRGCQAELRLTVPDALASADQGDLINGTYCVAYLNGFIANETTEHTEICPGEQPMAELVRAYVQFMQRNPKFLDQDKRIGVRLALQSSFPCSVRGASAERSVPLQRDRL